MIDDYIIQELNRRKNKFINFLKEKNRYEEYLSDIKKVYKDETQEINLRLLCTYINMFTSISHFGNNFKWNDISIEWNNKLNAEEEIYVNKKIFMRFIKENNIYNNVTHNLNKADDNVKTLLYLNYFQTILYYAYVNKDVNDIQCKWELYLDNILNNFCNDWQYK